MGDADTRFGQIRAKLECSTEIRRGFVQLAKLGEDNSKIGVHLGIIREFLAHQLPKFSRLRALVKIDQLLVRLDGQFRSGIGPEFSERSGYFQLLGGFPFFQNQDKVTRASGTSIKDALSR